MLLYRTCYKSVFYHLVIIEDLPKCVCILIALFVKLIELQ